MQYAQLEVFISSQILCGGTDRNAFAAENSVIYHSDAHVPFSNRPEHSAMLPIHFFDRVLNWSEKKVSNFYDLPVPKQSSRYTPLQLNSRAAPSRVGSFGGHDCDFRPENNSIDSSSLSKSGSRNLVGPTSNVFLDVCS